MGVQLGLGQAAEQLTRQHRRPAAPRRARTTTRRMEPAASGASSGSSMPRASVTRARARGGARLQRRVVRTDARRARRCRARRRPAVALTNTRMPSLIDRVETNAAARAASTGWGSRRRNAATASTSSSPARSAAGPRSGAEAARAGGASPRRSPGCTRRRRGASGRPAARRRAPACRPRARGIVAHLRAGQVDRGPPCPSSARSSTAVSCAPVSVSRTRSLRAGSTALEPRVGHRPGRQIRADRLAANRGPGRPGARCAALRRAGRRADTASPSRTSGRLISASGRGQRASRSGAR